MKVGIFSHCTMDTIIYENEQYDAPGGPASYCSIAAITLAQRIAVLMKNR